MTFARANVRKIGGRFPKECKGHGQHLTDTLPWRTVFADVLWTGGRRITDMWSDLSGSWNPFVVISIPLTPLFGSTMHVNPLSAERDHAALLNDHRSVFFFSLIFFINSRNITARARFFVPENLELTIRFQLRNIFLLKKSTYSLWEMRNPTACPVSRSTTLAGLSDEKNPVNEAVPRWNRNLL